jgi:flagellar basal body rod protein FlgC
MDAISSAGAALNAQSVKVSVVAEHSANAATPNNVPKQATPLALNPGAAVEATTAPPLPRVNIGSELLSMLVGQQAYAAASKVASASDQMTHDLLKAV